ncbi:hypothetical protein FIBSPDRAFT_906254, partial [Athelia psychrophila]
MSSSTRSDGNTSMRQEWPGGRPEFLPPGITAPRSAEEATCLLNLVQASRSVEQSRKLLAKRRAQQCRNLAELYELQARNADGRLTKADLDIGRVTSAVRRSGMFTLPSPAMALKKYRVKYRVK